MSNSEIKKVEIGVQMECACKGCEKKVKKSVEKIAGVKQVKMDRHKGKLTVTGRVNPKDVLECVRCRTRKKAWFWPKPESSNEASDEPESSHHASAEPEPSYHAPAEPEPSSYALAYSNAINFEELGRPDYTTIFSDENTNGCSIM